MFLRRYHRTKDGKTHTYYALVESVRTEAGPRQRVVAHLGELNHDEERRWQRTVVFHNRQGEGRQLRLFPDDDHVDSARRSRRRPDQLEIRGLGQPSSVRRRLAGALALATSQARRDRRPACSPGQRDDSSRRHRGHRGDQPLVRTLH